MKYLKSLKYLFLQSTRLSILFGLFLVSSLQAATQPEFPIATFAGGCFWCTEADLEKAPGVISAVSGFSGGTKPNPSYDEVARGATNHIESVQVTYDPALISYEQLLEYFWRNINPTDNQGQFADRGPHYRPAIFYHNEEQKQAALAGFKSLESKFDKPIVVELIPSSQFYKAEEYHQDYYKKSSLKYKFYRSRSGRDDFLAKHWDSPPAHYTTYKSVSKKTLEKKLSDIAFEVTQEDGTEKPFDNEYWDNTEPGIYVDVVSGEPLFSSTHKFKSGTGWPSFTQPIVDHYLVEKNDYKLIIPRTEVRSKVADSHLGHVFDDGPAPTGLRYCVNSAALRFIPKEQMEQEGYGHYLSLFAGQESP